MSLDKVLIKHLDNQDVLENQIEDDIESLIRGIKISDLMNSSEEIFLNIVEQIQIRLKDVYYPKTSENGIKLAEEIEADGDIIIPISKDPNLNEGLVNDGQGESKN